MSSVWLTTLGRTYDPSLAWNSVGESDVFKIKDDYDELRMITNGVVKIKGKQGILLNYQKLQEKIPDTTV